MPPVAKSAGTGILKAVKLEYIPITSAGISKVPLITGSLLSRSQGKLLQKEHRKLLRIAQNSQLGTEAISYYDMDLKLLHHAKGKAGANRVKSVPQSVPCIVMHNHPDGLTFTEDDLIQFVKNSEINILTAVGNNGRVYLLEKSQNYDASGFLEHWSYERQEHPDYLQSPENYVDFIEFMLKGGKRYGVGYYQGP